LQTSRAHKKILFINRNSTLSRETQQKTRGNGKKLKVVCFHTRRTRTPEGIRKSRAIKNVLKSSDTKMPFFDPACCFFNFSRAILLSFCNKKNMKAKRGERVTKRNHKYLNRHGYGIMNWVECF
jgi:hypothetical protein